MPRAGLSPARVVELALEVLEEDGWDGLTLAAVATRAGVAVPSLYKHVRGLPELRRRVAVVCIEEFDATLRSAGGDITALARAARGYGLAHPGRYTAVQGGPWLRQGEDPELASASTRAVTTIADALAAPDLGDTARVDAVRAVRALVHGFVTLEAAGGFGLPEDVDASFSAAVDALVAGLTGARRSTTAAGPKGSAAVVSSSVAAQDRQDPQDLQVQPDQRDDQAEGS